MEDSGARIECIEQWIDRYPTTDSQFYLHAISRMLGRLRLQPQGPIASTDLLAAIDAFRLWLNWIRYRSDSAQVTTLLGWAAEEQYTRLTHRPTFLQITPQQVEQTMCAILDEIDQRLRD